ncbi:MAG: copper-binding protein [Phenylobacterium sp.]|uniref:lipoprotein n=1 Tax=Phenylobacterium sp. TaxID=1871053 RepID=UPI002715E497|nr:lipoprotein [Phenylobacterium sp.]MDO8902785.1 copper-binding protein [Phenylobacterium sp.]MDP2212327.1 copper-binding protein [Phenylobacterium sp.]
MRAVLFAAALASTLALAACGQSSDTGPSVAEVAPTGPELSGVGVIAALDGRTLAIDHEGVEGGQPAGRQEFRAYATVLAEAPLEPGARVSFKYQDAEPLPVLTELSAR